MALFDWENNMPDPDEYGSFYQGYIDLMQSKKVMQALVEQGQQVYSLIQQLSSEEADFRYADDKWSVREVLGHLVDTERVMSYRAMCISRGEQTSLPGFDQDEYVREGNFPERDLRNLSAEYDALRNANISLFNSFSREQMLRTGVANDNKVSVRALAYIIAGHERHHINILEEKYKLDISSGRSEK